MANCRYCGTDCPEQGEHDRFFDCALYTKRKPTNADRIRGMSDEELAGVLHQAYADGMCDMVRSMRDVDAHVNTISDYQNWLQQPAETEGAE